MKFRRLSAAVVSTVLITGGLTVAMVSPAQALQGTVPGVTSSSWQTNGNVRALASASGVLFVGGDFTSVRPPGAALGTGEVSRSRLAAFNSSTGALITSFNHTFNGNVRALASSVDGTIMYVGGDFTTVDGVTRNRVAAFNVSTGALTSFAPSSNSGVYGIATSPTRVYLGGNFTRVAGVDTTRVAAVTTTGAGIPTFVVNADRLIYGIAISKTYDKLYVAGGFLSFNGDGTMHGAAAVSADTGATLPFQAAFDAIPDYNGGCVTEMKTVTTDANNVYFGSEGTGGGCFDGTFAARVSDGSLVWKNNCLGATQGIAVLNGFLYTGSHGHDCQSNTFDPDAFPEVGWARGLSRHLLSFSVADGTTGPWYPNTNGGAQATGLGPRVLATDGNQIFVGGEFTTVNGAAQQGFTRFAPLAGGGSAVPARPATPRAVALPGGAISISVQPPLDLDDTDLTIRLYRDGAAQPVASQDVHALFWRNPIVTFVDSGFPLNSLHTYTVDAIEKNGTQASQKSPSSAQVRSVATVGTYQAAINADNPSLFWRLGEPAGPTAANASANGEGGTYWRPFTYGVAGPIPGDPTAVTTNGIDSVVSSNKLSGPATYSAEVWFKTTTTAGGKIIGFGNKQNGYDFSGNPGVSSNYDKHVYMTNDGRLIFGVYNGGFDLVSSSGAYNDGEWHHVVATQGSRGMAMYVDGASVGKNGQTNNQGYDGYWRVGGDNLNAWPDQPSSAFFAGTIADVAVYPNALNLTQVRAHYSAAGRTPPVLPLPSDTYGQAVYADEPLQYLRLDEASGTDVADTSNNGATGIAVDGVTRGVGGALPFGSAAAFDGASGYVTSTNATSSPSTYSVETWFNTSTTNGGKIIGFGASQFGFSGGYDKHLYMTNDGRLIFGVWNNQPDTVRSGGGFNDGQWHHVVATQGSGGMQLYVDDVLVDSNGVTTNQNYGGYWRLGGDNLGGWPDGPNSYYFNGLIDDSAIYDTVLTGAQVNTHYLASGRVLADTTDPTAAITTPADGATVNEGPVSIEAAASDNIEVSSVEFFVDGVSVGNDTSSPYAYSWNATAGAHSLTAVATDSSGNTGTSGAVGVTVVVPDTTDPTVSIDSPADGASFNAGATTIDATASDDTAVTSVEFFVDGVSVGSDSSSPYSVAWNAGGGSHALTAVASDAAGNTGTSSTVNVTVVVPDLTDPDVAIDSPAEGASFDEGSATITATATDNVGVTSVEFFVDGVSVGSDSSSPYSASWTATAGAHALTAVASDAAGNTGTSTTVNVTVTVPDTTDPVVSIDSPADGATPYGTTTIAASATDDTGVTSVEFFVDGVSVGSDSSSPYSVSWNAIAEGAHVLTAVAVDAAGNSGTSAAVNVTVPADTTEPTVEITSPADGATPYGTTSIAASASDDRGVSSVEFFVDGVSVGSDSSSPYSVSWNAIAEGAHVLTAVAVDAAGNDATSAAVNVTVPTDTSNPTAPSGLAASSVTQTTLSLSWNASSDDRGVTGYRVVRDGVVLPGVVNGLTFADSGLTASTSYSYVVRAIDAAGNISADSNTVTVTTASSSLFTDSWANANNSPWAAAWTTSTSNGTVDTQGAAGRLQFGDVAGAYSRAQLTGVAARSDMDVTFTYQWSSTSARAYFDVWTRGSGGWANSYRPRNGYGLELSSTSGTLAVLKSVNGTQTTVRTVTGAQSVSTAAQKIRVRVQGSQIQVKIWLASASEPVAWTSTDTDTDVTAAGQLFLSLNRAGTNVGAKSVTIDDITVSPTN